MGKHIKNNMISTPYERKRRKPLLNQAVDRLQELLPAKWLVGVQQQNTKMADFVRRAIMLEQITLRSPQNTCVLVDEQNSMDPHCWSPAWNLRSTAAQLH